MDPTSSENLIADLNPSQRAAVTHGEGPLLVLAGPGSGKTRVLTHRIAYLISQGVQSHHILALTFTNKAADELKNRIEFLSPGHDAWAGTFHRFCSRLLRVYAPYIGLAENFTIYDTSDSRQVLKESIARLGLESLQHSPDKIAGAISNIKSQGILPEQVSERARTHLDELAQRIYPTYQQLLQESNAADFDDLLLYIVQLLHENAEIRQALSDRYQYVLVDEYQDTNQAQYKILRGLCAANANLMVTGDPDQSIYGWRGATISNILQFENDFDDVRVVRLEQNYRSTQSILRAADQLICNNLQRKQKTLTTDNSDGSPITLAAMPTQQEEARFVVQSIAHAMEKDGRTPKDFAVFYRVNWLSRSLEHELHLHGIPYQIVHGLEFFSRKEIKDVLAYLHLINNPNDNLAIQRVINVPPRKIGKVTMTRLKNYAVESGCSILEAARRAGSIETISKGVATKIAQFVATYDAICLHKHEKAESVIGHVLSKTNYRDYLLEAGDEEAFQRAANVDELMNSAREFDILLDEESNIERFLEQAVLVNDTDAWEQDTDRVTLMTLHAAKGLEFPCVFIVGIEDGILPHERSRQDITELEEERRLFFVGITRAQEQLSLSYSMKRFRRGSNWPTIASKFLMELPREEMQISEPKPPRKPIDYDDDFSDDEYVDEFSEIPEDDSSADQVRERQATFTTSPIMTAADMLGDETTQPVVVNPDEFEFGMVVVHPEYGSGRVVALSGEGKKRKANIEFFNGKEQTFVLVHSKLRPLARENSS